MNWPVVVISPPRPVGKSAAATLASPKSTTTGSPFASSRMFAGLRSRWITPLRWAAFTPSQIFANISRRARSSPPASTLDLAAALPTPLDDRARLRSASVRHSRMSASRGLPPTKSIT